MGYTLMYELEPRSMRKDKIAIWVSGLGLQLPRRITFEVHPLP